MNTSRQYVKLSAKIEYENDKDAQALKTRQRKTVIKNKSGSSSWIDAKHVSCDEKNLQKEKKKKKQGTNESDLYYQQHGSFRL